MLYILIQSCYHTKVPVLCVFAKLKTWGRFPILPTFMKFMKSKYKLTLWPQDTPSTYTSKCLIVEALEADNKAIKITTL